MSCLLGASHRCHRCHLAIRLTRLANTYRWLSPGFSRTIEGKGRERACLVGWGGNGRFNFNSLLVALVLIIWLKWDLKL